MGGHYKNTHRGMSDNHKRKMEIEQQRTLDRLALKTTKELYKEIHGEDQKPNKYVFKKMKEEIYSRLI